MTPDTSPSAAFGWQASPVPFHDLVDVSVSVEDGTRRYIGRCRCGWESQDCQTAVHALALVEDHGARSRMKARRRALPSSADTAADAAERTAG